MLKVSLLESGERSLSEDGLNGSYSKVNGMMDLKMYGFWLYSRTTGKFSMQIWIEFSSQQ